MKVFRKVTPGRNPDIVIHRALTERDNEHVAALYGWLETGDEPAGPARDAAAVPAHRERRLGARARQRPRPVRRGRPARRRGGRRLRRRGRAARPGDRRGARRARRGVPHRAVRAGAAVRPCPRPCRAGSMPPRSWCPSSPSTPTRCAHLPRGRGPGRLGETADARSGCTATSTSARRCAPSGAGRSSTSRASRPSRSPSGCCPTWCGATSRACCAPSTTPPTR